MLYARAETTFRSTGNLLFPRLTYDGVYERMRSDRSLHPRLLTRYCGLSPHCCPIRQALVDTELGGVAIPAGATVELSLAQPTAMPPGAATPTSSTSTASPAVCLVRYRPAPVPGHALAKLEMQVAVEAILDQPGLDPVEMAKGATHPRHDLPIADIVAGAVGHLRHSVPFAR